MSMKPFTMLCLLTMAVLVFGTGHRATTGETKTLTVVVMDPLSKPLSCPCVEGYAQREYKALAAYLEKRLGEEVKLVFADALGKALKGDAKGRADLIIGKDSVVRADAAEHKFTVTPVGRLTGKLGLTTQTGLIVVAKNDPAKKVADLAGYRILFGPKECDEKHAAAKSLLRKANVAIPKKLEIDQSCSDGAGKVIELSGKVRIAAVISSYAAPLLEGCGTIQKGDLRVLGRTKPVPFVTAFTTNTVDASRRRRIQAALLATGDDPELCKAIESLIGFVPIEEKKSPMSASTSTTSPAKKK